MILRLSSAKVGRAINSAIINEISAALLCWAEIKMCTAWCCVAVAMLLMVLTSDASSVAGLVVEARAGALRSVFIVSVP